MSIHRLHIRPTGGRGDPSFSFAYCLRQGVLGVGWQVTPPSEAPLTWADYESLATNEYGGVDEISRVRYLHDKVKPRDLIWTRGTDGRYFLAKVSPARCSSDSGSAWEYFDTPEGRDADIVNVVRCHILPVPQVDDVPGKIVACFRPRRVIQPVVDETAVQYSQLLWNQLVGCEEYKLPDLRKCDISSFLDAESTEDVIFIYLQCEGWIVVPNSRKADTMRYEFLAINPKTGERALTQVKTGNEPLETDTWGRFQEKVYLFQANGIYPGAPAANVVPLAPKAIEEFMRSHFEIMPRAVQRWLDFTKLNSSR
jgi:hypothetical protein